MGPRRAKLFLILSSMFFLSRLYFICLSFSTFPCPSFSSLFLPLLLWLCRSVVSASSFLLSFPLPFRISSLLYLPLIRFSFSFKLEEFENLLGKPETLLPNLIPESVLDPRLNDRRRSSSSGLVIEFLSSGTFLIQLSSEY